VSDLKLFEGLKHGDRKAINEIYKNISPKVIYWVKNNSGSEEDGYDIFQESLEIILLKIESLNSSLGGLIMRIAQRKWIDKLRKNKVSIISADNSLSENIQAYEDQAVVEHEKHKLMDHTFSKLSALCQKIIIALKKGSTVDEIVRTLEMSSANTLYRRKSACIERWSILIKEQNSYKELFN